MDEQTIQDVSQLGDTELKEALSQARTKAAESEDTVAEQQPDTKQQEPEKTEHRKDEFVFDDKAYRDQGFNDAQLEILKKKDKQIWHEQQMIQRQSNEVAEARKKEIEIAARERELAEKLSEASQKVEELKDDVYSDPEAYKNAIIEEQRLREEQSRLVQESKANNTKNIVLNAIPNLNDLMPEIEQVIKEEAKLYGLAENDPQVLTAVQNVKQGNWVHGQPQKVIEVALRAKLLKENQEYKQKLKEISSSPDTVGKKIAQIASQRPIPTTTYTSENKVYTREEISGMSDAELKEALRRARESLEE